MTTFSSMLTLQFLFPTFIQQRCVHFHFYSFDHVSTFLVGEIQESIVPKSACRDDTM